MPKHKQKAKKSKTRFKPHTSLRRGMLAGAVFALLALPVGMLAVNAQSVDTIPGKSDASIRDGAAAAGTAGSNAGHSVKSSHSASADKPGSAQKQAANAKDTSKTGAPSSGKPAPAPIAAPAPVPVAPPAAPANGWHENIITTIFWAGEAADASNANISNAQSAWDGNWETHYGGFDNPDQRNGYYPAAFTPLENPFYFALPYNDLDENGNRKASAASCPNTGSPISWCKNAWIKITKGSKTAYAQWQDVGPLQEDDTAYVFGTAQPKNSWGAKAGLDVSPAVRDYLGLQGIDRTDWAFVPASEVPAGPWKTIVTTSAGGW